MRQDKLTGSLRRGGRCLKRQSGGGGGVGTILSNVLKKRSCISRTAPRLLCTLEPGKARVVDGHRGAGGRDGSRLRSGCIQGCQGTDDPAVLKKPPRGLCTRWGSEGGCPFQPRLRHLLCFGFPGSQTSKEVCGLALTSQGGGKGSYCKGRSRACFPQSPCGVFVLG